MLDSYARRHMLCRMLCLLSLITFSFFLSTPQDSFFLLPCIFLLFFSKCDRSRVCSKHRLISYWTNDASFFIYKNG